MELIVAQHPDFTLTIGNENFHKIWGKAIGNIGADGLISYWKWSDPEITSVELKNASEVTQLSPESNASAVFFDNADYPIWVEFNPQVKDAHLSLPGRRIKEKGNDAKEIYSFRKKPNMLSGFINYGNDIGRSYIKVIYILEGGERREWRIDFEVLSTKLNYHEHWRTIIKDIEDEYRMLSLDFLRRTFHCFNPDTKGDSPEIVWWSIFGSLQKDFIKAARQIIDRPRHKLRDVPVYVRQEKLRKLTHQIEEEFAENNKSNPRHYYRVMEPTNSNDTIENRFLKHVLMHINNRYNRLSKRIKALANIDRKVLEDIEETEKTLQRLARHPFFRTVSNFNGLTQESQVLQNATGYSTIYRSWIILNKSYSLAEGVHNLETKDIATLFEIWCFIQVKNIVKSHLGEDVEVVNRSRIEMGPLFSYNLGKGQNSSILFKKDDIELAELVYNPQEDGRSNEDTGIKNLISRTVPQRPDIVLQLTKNDIESGMKMTYLFDAKYRIDHRHNGVDTPPEETINQMHRYRDAIYFQNNSISPYEPQEMVSKMLLKKEVIGGYILFPGTGENDELARSRFIESIKEVNIGAFPLRPNDKGNRMFLEEFICTLINNKASDILTENNMIAQKGLKYVKQDDVTKEPLFYLGYIPPYSHLMRQYLEHEATLFYSGENVNSDIDIQSIKWFAPIIKNEHGEKGIMDGYYDVISVGIASKKDLHLPANEKDGMRLKLELGQFHSLPNHLLIERDFYNKTYRGLSMTKEEFKELENKF